MSSVRLSEQEATFIDLVLEAGDRALERDTFEFMVDEGVLADTLLGQNRDFTLGKVVESLTEKGLVYVESREETIQYNGGLLGRGIESVKWESAGFRTVDRQYIHFTEDLEELYRE